MAELIKLPAVAADSAGGALAQWLKQEGDTVRAGDGLAEIETDKAIVEINAEQGGVLARIVVPAGPAQLAVNTVLGVIRFAGESDADVARALAEAGTAVAPQAPTAAQSPAPAATAAAPGVVAPATAPASAAPASSAEPAGSGEPGRQLASPLARRIARELGVDLAGVSGSGPRGRVVKRDVEHAAARGAAAPAASRNAANPAANPAATRLPHSNMRRTIARRLTESKQAVPHFYLTVDCRMDALLDLREQVCRQGPRKVSVNDFIVKAAALALVEVPEVNVSWEPDALLRHASADICVAVATEGGLTTPVLRNAERKSLVELAGEIAELAGRAREQRLRPEEYSGGSMTISNLGMYGVREFAAIINPPQAAILAVGAAERRAVVDDDGAVTAARMMTVTLSADHRAVDGAVAARWLAAFRQLVEAPLRILL
ncbi:pyruvate dehydrogenase complex dihydrolipoamide acetyltransferase [Bordetella genomosp. 1]|uniref:Acetyltransferase component of pyruvate dehydrogenase complex n=1 Tax=Bordetella genomosp. 1 TaxID=1395607 RepID=A0ABX4F5Z3_9BORD|nr:pyruvate dehydrogenase complex dihydrolipoamide acetyltransferase [Bordetella genomosp. 1]OZI69189.1 pyruvate dehydrogenase complex dihydrolipoamide acetyltransferase [Bordetella genomosp. 1]